MNVNLELLGIFITVLFQAFYFAHKMGVIEKSISMLEEKQDKHNNLIERMVKVESSSTSAHLRIDEMESNCHKILRDRLKKDD